MNGQAQVQWAKEVHQRCEKYSIGIEDTGNREMFNKKSEGPVQNKANKNGEKRVRVSQRTKEYWRKTKDVRKVKGVV